MERSKREALMDGLDEIDYLVAELNLSDSVQQKATKIYRKAIEANNIIAGRGVPTVVAGCVLLASRQSEDVYEASDIAEHSKDYIEAKTIHRATKVMRKELDLGFVLADPHKFVDKLQEELNETDEAAEQAHEFVEIVVDDGIASGKKASAIAASCFYIVSILDPENSTQGKHTQSEIADAANVTEVTIRNRYQEFSEVLNIHD